MLALDFGFDLSATRAAAASRDDAHGLDRIVSGVQTAKLLVLGVASVIAGGFLLMAPASLGDRQLLLYTALFAVARGLNPFWYFQGTGRLRFALAVETFTKISAAGLVFVFVLTPADAWRVLQLQAIGAVVSLTVLSAALVRARPAGRLAVDEGWRSLRATVPLFAFRLSSGLNLLQPITLVFMPRVSHLHATDPVRAHHEIRHLLMVIGSAGAAFGLMLAAAAPFVVHTMLGQGYDDAIPVMRILALLPPTTAVGTVLGMYWAVPFGRERAFLAAVMVAGACNLALVPVMVPWFGAPGMAASAVAAEVIVTVSLAVLYVRDRARVLASEQPT
jgi:PST family polysaccharide transporter